MNAIGRILAIAAVLGLPACNAPGGPSARTGSAGQDTPATLATPPAHVNPPETSSGY